MDAFFPPIPDMFPPLPLKVDHYYKYDPNDLKTGPLGFGYTNNITNFLYEHRDDIKYFRVDEINSHETYITVFFNDGTQTDRIVNQPGYKNQRLYLQRDYFRDYPVRGNPIREYFKDLAVEMAKEVSGQSLLPTPAHVLAVIRAWKDRF